MPPPFRVQYKQLKIFVVWTSDVEAFWFLILQLAHQCCYGSLATELWEDCSVWGCNTNMLLWSQWKWMLLVKDNPSSKWALDGHFTPRLYLLSSLSCINCHLWAIRIKTKSLVERDFGTLSVLILLNRILTGISVFFLTHYQVFSTGHPGCSFKMCKPMAPHCS